MSTQPLCVAIIGLGGFAAEHHRVFAAIEAIGGCRVVAGCDPHLEQFTDQCCALNFSQRGVALYADYIEMLDAHQHDLDIVVVPTPIPLHAVMHKACVERGLACYLEKPPTLFWSELEDMLAVETAAVKSTNVGFVHIAEAPRQAMKRRIVEGEFGRVVKTTFLAHWPRDTAYFQRVPWAGRLKMDERLVLDSCIGNAVSHLVHDLLFWSGQEAPTAWASVAELECQLYRAHAIEGFDTCFARGRCENGVEFRIGAGHACDGRRWHRETIECEAATITYVSDPMIEVNITWKNGQTDHQSYAQPDLLRANVEAYLQYVSGGASRPLSSLLDTKPFVLLNDLLYVAAGHISTVAESSLVRGVPNKNGGQSVAINGFEQALEELGTKGLLPSETSAPWAHPGGTARVGDEVGLEATVVSMLRM